MGREDAERFARPKSLHNGAVYLLRAALVRRPATSQLSRAGRAGWCARLQEVNGARRAGSAAMLSATCGPLANQLRKPL